MDAIRKQASKLREQVAKQQQAVLRQLGHLGSATVIADEAELHCHEQLQKLYESTSATKHFQRDLLRGVKGFISTSSKQIEIARQLAEDCFKYGNDNECSGSALANTSLLFGASQNLVEQEKENLLRILRVQVCEPLHASIGSAPLEDARHLTHRYDRIRHDVEAQAAEVAKRQLKYNEVVASSESSIKLQNAKAKLTDLRSTMMALGREATNAMSSVEVQQQQLTLQRLVTMVTAERSFHQNAAAILEKLNAEMIQEKQQIESETQPAPMKRNLFVPHVQEVQEEASSNDIGDLEPPMQEETYFIAQVIHPFDGQADGELTFAVGEYVVVRQVTQTGWSEGECNGKAGWFPSAYVEKMRNAEVVMSPKDNSLP